MPKRTASRSLGQPDVFWLTGTGWEPPVDVLETETGLLVIVALPGVRAGDMEIVIGNGELTILGMRRWPTLPGPTRVQRIELPHGRFERRLPPPGHTGSETTHFRRNLGKQRVRLV